MLIMFKVTVAVAGTPGPLLGDGVNSTVTMLYPATLTEDLNSMGSRQSVINRAAASGRADYSVAKLTLLTLAANTEPALWGARGSALANMARTIDPASATASSVLAAGCPLGFGDRNDINLGDIDVDVITSTEGWLVIAEVR